MGSKFLYNLFLVLYAAGIKLTAAWNPKAKKWLQGRRNIFSEISVQLYADKGQPVWMHCASLGEFEQGRPLLEALKLYNPQQKIILTFFSPSGYEVMKNYKGADHVFYLPMDSTVNAARFLDIVKPSLVLWVKYEFWYYYLTALKQRNIPTILVSGIFRQNQPFFKWYGGIWRKMLKTFTHFFVQNDASSLLLADLGFTNNVTLNGDTRFDRVLEIAENFMPVPCIADFCGDSKVLVAGSTWEEDEIELLHFVHVNKHIKFIIAPHEIGKTNLRDVKETFPDSVFYSDLIQKNDAGKAVVEKKEMLFTEDGQQPVINSKAVNPHVLIIDNIGMLSSLYQYASVTYVGGGFGADGVHNVLEAAVYGKPVIFGPVYEKFDEAAGLVNASGGISVDGPVNLELTLDRLLNNETERMQRGAAAKQFVYKNAGASENILRFLQENRLFTN